MNGQDIGQFLLMVIKEIAAKLPRIKVTNW